MAELNADITPEQEAYLIALAEAGERRQRALDAFNEATTTVNELVVGARRVGITPPHLYKAAQLSRQRVWQILDAAGTSKKAEQQVTA